MCWTKNLFVFLSVAVRRRRPPAYRRCCATRASARAAREARGCLEGEEYPHPAKNEKRLFFLHANIFQMTHSLQNIRLTKNISHNTASRYLDILRGMITYRHIQPSHKSWMNKSTTLESKGKILVGF